MIATEAYYDRLRDSREPEWYRRAMIDFFFAHGENVSETARIFRTSRPTVLKWVQRFRKQGQRGLRDRSRRPHRCPHKTPPHHEELIAKLRTNHGKKPKTRIGQDKIRLLLYQRHGLDISSSTINRVLNARRLIRPRRRKYQKKREIAAYRKQLRALGFWQVDVKYLNDIPHLYPLVLRRILPKYEYTIRDVITGTTFVCYAHQLSTLNSARFIALCFDHFRRYGLDLSQITVQTDNGSEFIGSITAKKDSLFTRTIEKTFGARHCTIPPATPRFNGAVENFHGRVEDEFYDLEDLPDTPRLLSKASTYMLYFNLERPNLNLKKTPLQAVQQHTHIQDPAFMAFPPLVLDHLPLFGPRLRPVNDVSDEVTQPLTIFNSCIIIDRVVSLQCEYRNSVSTLGDGLRLGRSRLLSPRCLVG
jgi:transposase